MGDWLKPTLTDLYTDFLDYIKQRDDDCRTFFQGVVSDVTFTDAGSGLNDLHVDGWPTADRHFVIEIDGTGDPDTFKWSKDGGTTWEATGIELATNVSLSDGISVGWTNTTGHSIGDKWEFKTKIPENLLNRTVIFDRNSKSWKYWDATREEYVDLVDESDYYGIVVANAKALKSDSGEVFYPGNSEGNIPLNNGNLNSNLNADLLDNKHANEFASSSHASTHHNGGSDPLDHGSLPGLGNDDHPQYLNTSRHDTTTRHSLGTVVPHDAFIGLTDSPSSYTSYGGQFVRVKSTEDGLEFAVVDTTPPDGSITQAKLKTSIGEVSTTSSANLTLPGGEYGFYPQVKGGFSIDYPMSGQIVKNLYATSYVTNIYLEGSSNGTAYAQQRYVTSSGEVFWLFFLMDKTTGNIIASYAAPDHPCFGNGNDPMLVPHPFLDYNPEKHEIVVINPTEDELKQMKALTRKEKLGMGQRNILELFTMHPHPADLTGKTLEDPFFEIDHSVEREYPNKEITIGIVEDKDKKPLWVKESANIVKVNIKKYQPDFIKVRKLRKLRDL